MQKTQTFMLAINRMLHDVISKGEDSSDESEFIDNSDMGPNFILPNEES